MSTEKRYIYLNRDLFSNLKTQIKIGFGTNPDGTKIDDYPNPFHKLIPKFRNKGKRKRKIIDYISIGIISAFLSK